MEVNNLYKELEHPSLKNLTNGFGKLPETQSEILRLLGEPHIESFNFMLNDGLRKAMDDLRVEFVLENSDRVAIWFENFDILPPGVPKGTIGSRSLKILPTECRQRGATYKGSLMGHLLCSVNGKALTSLPVELGEIPIMIKSEKCHLAKLSPTELVKKSEHAEEWGGYFITKGHERLIRMLLLTRRNHPIGVRRSTWKNRDKQFSDLGVFIRCVSEDETSTNNVLHYVTSGTAKLMFSHRRSLYYAPLILILKALLDVSDEYIFKRLITGFEDNLYYKGCVIDMLQRLHEEGLHSHLDIKQYIGKIFRVKFFILPPWTTDIEICDYIIEKCLAIHLKDNIDKFNLYVLMTQKLFTLVNEDCCVEGMDSVMNQEVLLGGHLYLKVLKEKLQLWLVILKSLITKKATSVAFKLTPGELASLIKKTGTVEHSMESFISTGNIQSPSGLGLQQDKGLTILVENINRMRYMSHFRAVHRGAYFQEMRTTEVRQLLPDAWGFICPVHTPDGSPCGLLNHLTKYCVITQSPDPKLVANIPLILVALGMFPFNAAVPVHPLNICYVVMLDGRMLGYIERSETPAIVTKLRVLKIAGEKVPNTLEIAFIPKCKKGQFPGLYLFTTPARMMRPVINLAVQKIELIGTMEQVYMDICVVPEEAYAETTHQEVSSTGFLSNLACLIPLPDCNQSPRNMYQCQMGKQTMGTPCHTWNLQSETKLYRLQTPQSPFFRPTHHDKMNLDDFAMGTNAIVAVISYTGYDMEDAMIINKASFERGFAHGSVYKSEIIDLSSANSYFGTDSNSITSLDTDGFPPVGSVLTEGCPYYSFYDFDQSKFVVKKWKNKESVAVESVKLCTGPSTRTPRRAIITVRITRNPSVGDKFASRAGQKGICSQLWPVEDLPFTETGLFPDIIFNPHGFPSRMTIAMMVEVMAGKSAAIHGLVHDATPFKFSESDMAADYFGHMLEAGGYNYYGTEKMYSGIDGCEMEVAIFFGIVHYQRLRHMVSDKWQVRSTGPVDMLTHQPVQGRKRGGGVRFGEMERDAILAHGTSFLLQDRLFHCSDKTTALVCSTCGNLLSTVEIPDKRCKGNYSNIKCFLCDKDGDVREIAIPYIFRYLVAQLSSVNIRVKLDIVQR